MESRDRDIVGISEAFASGARVAMAGPRMDFAADRLQSFGFETVWCAPGDGAEYLHPVRFEMKVVGRTEEFRLRPSIAGLPFTDGLPEATNIVGSNITEIESIECIEDHYVQGAVIEATLSTTDMAEAISAVESGFPDARLLSGSYPSATRFAF